MAGVSRIGAALRAPVRVCDGDGFRVVVAGPEHADGLCRLEEALFSCDCMTRRTILRFLRVPSACVLVAEAASGVEGASLFRARAVRTVKGESGGRGNADGGGVPGKSAVGEFSGDGEVSVPDLAGYAMVLFRKGSSRARLYSLAVGKDMQGRGVGRALLAAAEDHAGRRGRSRLGLEVRPDNYRALALYASLGFERTGYRTDYYEDGSDAVLMEKAL